MNISVLIVILAIVVGSWQQKQPAEIVLYESDGDDKSYSFQYETSDGIARVEKGEYIESSQPGEQYLSVQGSYIYTDDVGKQHRVSYKADNTGFHVLPNP